MPAQIRRLYSNLALGYHATAPPRALDPEGGSPYIYRDLLNFIERDGVLIRRAVIDDDFGVAVPHQFLPGAADDSETPLHAFIIQHPGTGASPQLCIIVVTNRLVYIHPFNAAAWVIANPTYSTGTLTATNGSVNITGAGGTLWSTRLITAGALITIAGVNYQIASVTGDTTATLTTNYLGATGAGKAYTIYRSFPGGSPFQTGGTINHIFATVFNNSLYIAGTYCGSSSASVRQPAVIKVTNIFSAPTGAYITAQGALTAGLDTISNLTRICGLKALQDGRIVVAGEQNTVFYSSHLNDAVWTVSPGGQNPLVLIPGLITAQGSIGNVYTFHHDAGVVLGYPTGLSDPPLRYQASAADQGVGAPRTLQTLSDVEYGLTSNGVVIRFDKNRSTVVSDPIRPSLVAAGAGVVITSGLTFHGGIDKRHSEYLLFNPSSTGTKLWTYNTQGDLWWPGFISAPVGGYSEASAFGLEAIRAAVGVWSLNGAAEVTTTVLVYQEGLSVDSIAYSGFTASRFYIDTDDLDFGNPSSYKTAHRLLLWGYRILAGTIPIVVSVSRDQGKNWTALSSQNWPSTTETEAFLSFSFDELTPGAGLSLRFRVEVNTTDFLWQPRRMLIVALESGNLEQVEV